MSAIQNYWVFLASGIVLNLTPGSDSLYILPQFIDPSVAGSPVPFLLLGLTFFTTGTLWRLFLAFAASTLSKALRENKTLGRILNKVSGVVFLGLGLKIALEKR